jgi:hypothetical protein
LPQRAAEASWGRIAEPIPVGRYEEIGNTHLIA